MVADGKLIAFMAAESPNTSWKVYLVPFEGGKPRALQVNATNQGAPTWSPDGAKLAFGDLINKGNAPVNQAKIHIFDLKTRETTDLPGSEGLWTSRWSPNGNQMAALTADSRTVMVFNFRSHAWRKLAVAGFITDLNWSSDSAYIYLMDAPTPDGAAIVRVRVRDGNSVRLAGAERFGDTSAWIGLTPDGLPLVSRITARTEIFSAQWQEP